MFPFKNGLKQGDVLLPLILNCALQYAIGRVQVNQDDLKLNGAHQFLVYVDYVNTLGGSIHTTKRNTNASLVAQKEMDYK